MLKYRIVYGYSPTDYISIDDSDLEKAKYAWINNSIYTKNGRSIKGSVIQRIEPDFRAYTGWYDSYNPKEAEDFLQMKRDMPDQKLFDERDRLATERVNLAIRGNNINLLENNLKQIQ